MSAHGEPPDSEDVRARSVRRAQCIRGDQRPTLLVIPPKEALALGLPLSHRRLTLVIDPESARPGHLHGCLEVAVAHSLGSAALGPEWRNAHGHSF